MVGSHAALRTEVFVAGIAAHSMFSHVNSSLVCKLLSLVVFLIQVNCALGYLKSGATRTRPEIWILLDQML